MWQDAVISIVVIVFSLALIPQVYYGFKNKVGTIQHSASVPTFLGLFVLTGTYLTLDLYFSAIFACITGVLWVILFMQRLKYKDKIPAQQTPKTP